MHQLTALPKISYGTLAMIALVFVSITTSSAAARKSNDHDRLAKYQDAVEILGEAISAVGGWDAISNISAVEMHMEGGISNATQYASPAAMDEVHPEDSAISILLNFAGGVFRQDIDQTVRGGLGVRSVMSFSEGKLSIIWPHNKTYSQFPATPDSIIEFGSQAMPPLLLREAGKALATITYEGLGNIDGDKTNVIGFSWQGKKRYILHISKATHIVRALEYIKAEVLTGEESARVIFSGQQVIDGIVFPERLRQLRWDLPFADFALNNIAVNEEVAKPDLNIPENYKMVSPPIPTWAPIAEGVYEVRNLFIGNYRSIIIELEGSVVLFDAPIDSRTSYQVRKFISDNLGSKPISHLVLSHYHSDHVGGLGLYTTAGARVVSAPGNTEYYERIASSPNRVASIVKKPAVNIDIKYDIVGINETFRITDGNRTIEVTNIGPLPHVDGMLTAYIPDVGVAINGDLYEEGEGPENASHQSFRQWLKDMHPDIKLLSGVHHEPVTGEAYFE